jgi:PAS domain S-box-containing protein
MEPKPSSADRFLDHACRSVDTVPDESHAANATRAGLLMEPGSRGRQEPLPRSLLNNTAARLAFRSAAATLVIVAAILLEHAASAWPVLDRQFIFFVCALIPAAWLLGMGPSALAVTAGPGLANFFLQTKDGEFGLARVETIPSYFVMGILVILLIEWLRRSHWNGLGTAVENPPQPGWLKREAQIRQRVEKDLREREEQLRLFFENVRGVAMFSLDQEGRVNDWNQAAESVCGLAEEEILGRSIDHLLEGEGGAELAAPLLRRARERCCAVHKGWHPRRNGSIYLHSVTCAKYNDAGHAVGYLMIVLNLTEQAAAQEALRQSEERYRNLVESSAVGIVQLDSEGRFLEANGRFSEITGYSLDELRQLTFLDITFPEDRELDRKAFAKMRKGELAFLQREKRYQHKDGRILWGRVTASFLRDPEGNPQQTVALIEEITARKEAERALELAKNLLVQQSKALECAVAERTAKLRDSLRDMEDFCSTIAHHLRAPLRAMSGFSQALIEDYGSCLDETAADYCRRINAAGERMDRLILDLLAYERLAYLDLRLLPVEPAPVIEEMLAVLADQIQARQAAVDVESPFPTLLADVQVLKQVLQHLIENALKFVPPERPPHLRIYAERRAGKVRLWFEDNGIGVPMEHQNRIFEVFERLPSAHPGASGTGIGLAIIRRAVNLMGGNSGVESHPEQGSRFWIELPA